MIQIIKHIKTRINGEHSHKVLLKVGTEIITINVLPYMWQSDISLVELSKKLSLDCCFLADDISDAIKGKQIIN